MAKIKDLSPKRKIPLSGTELNFPQNFQDNLSQYVGGFQAGANELRSGKIKIRGVDEQILFGDAEDYSTGIGVFIGKDPDDGLYKFRAGDPAGVNLSWDGSAVTITGFLKDGEAAADVNSNSTTISGSKLTTGTVTADYVVASISISSPTITGGTIAIGTGNSIFKADSNGIYLGNATFASAPFRVNMSGNVTANSLTLTNALIGSGSTYTGNAISETYIGNLNASKITAGSIASARMETYVLTALQASVTSLSAITADIGTITAGTITADTVNVINLNASNFNRGTLYAGGAGNPSNITIYRNGQSGYLTWTGGNKIWSDGSQYMGFTSNGERFYFYTGTTLYALFQRGAQAGFYAGINCAGNFNVSSGDARINSGRLVINNASTNPSERLYVEGDGKFIGNITTNSHDPRSSASYNLGGSSQYWWYLNVKEISKQGGGGFGVFDDGVELQSGKVVSDIEAILNMKPHKTRKTDYGKFEYDLDTIPKAVRHIPKLDNNGNPIYKCGKKYLSKKKETVFDKRKKKYIEKEVEIEHTEGERVFVMMSIMIGAIRELSNKVKQLEKKQVISKKL